MSDSLDLGCFSVSLAVQDLDASQAFYEKLGFVTLGGGGDEARYVILGNGATKIGLFEQMFEKNILTFNPGLAQSWADDVRPAVESGADPIPGPDADFPGKLAEGSFTDVREIERRLVEAGIELTRRTDTESGADHITLVDPDGNEILIDQFF